MLPPNPQSPSPIPHYSLVRLSATSSNANWSQSNIPGATELLPQWADHIASTTSIRVPVAMAGRDADSDASGEDSDASSEDFDMPEEAGEQINPWRIRIWGLAASFGGGMSVALLSQHSTLGPDRKPKSKLVFAWKDRREDENEDVEMQDQAPPASDPGGLRIDPGFASHLSTEAKMWEWMYGGGPAVPFTIARPDVPTGWQTLRGEFEEAIKEQKCVFCLLPVEDTGRYSVCERKHSFGKLSSSLPPCLYLLSPPHHRPFHLKNPNCLRLAALRGPSLRSILASSALLDFILSLSFLQLLNTKFIRQLASLPTPPPCIPVLERTLTLSATCASTGLAIMAPGVSRACGICGLRTLSAAAMQQAAEEHGASLALLSEAPVEACGGCGGKFVA